MERAGYDLTAVELAEALGGLVGASTIRNWVTAGRLPSAYYWRSPSGRLYFKHKLVVWLLAGGQVAQPPEPAPRANSLKVKPVRWDRASDNGAA